MKMSTEDDAQEKVIFNSPEIITDNITRKSIFTFPGEDDEDPNAPWNQNNERVIKLPASVIDSLNLNESDMPFANYFEKMNKEYPDMDDIDIRDKWLLNNKSKDLIKQFIDSAHLCSPGTRYDYEITYSIKPEDRDKQLSLILASLSSQVVFNNNVAIWYVDEFITDWLTNNGDIHKSEEPRTLGVYEYGTYNSLGMFPPMIIMSCLNDLTKSYESWDSGWNRETGTYHTHSIESYSYLIADNKTIKISIYYDIERVNTGAK